MIVVAAGRRTYDLALFGATGFTGRLTAAYLARHAPAGLRWAVAGRDRTGLSALADQLAASSPDGARPEVVRADVDDDASMSALAAASSVVATTVGPFMEHGEALVAACAAAGTDYLDLTGEPEFVDRTWLRHHARASATGARLVHCCGFDSVPHDLGAWWTLRHLPEGVPVTMTGYVRAGGRISGGTYASAVRAFGRLRQTRQVAAERRAHEPPSSLRRVGALPARPHREPVSGGWTVPLPTIDPIVVRRSARALDAFGPDFRYGHFAVVGSLPVAVASVAAAGGVLALSQLGPTRRALLSLYQPGAGPTPEQRDRGWFSVRFVSSAGGTRVVTEVSGGDPGYTETATMLAESALCLALDDLPVTAGQVTTAEAMGQALVDRLERAGVGFRVVEPV